MISMVATYESPNNYIFFVTVSSHPLRSGSFTNGTPGPLSAGAGAFTDRQSMKCLIALNFCVKRFSERFEPLYGEKKSRIYSI